MVCECMWLLASKCEFVRVNISVSVCKGECKFEFVNVSWLAWSSECDFVTVSMWVWVCECEYRSVSMWVWVCGCDYRINENLKIILIHLK